MPESALESPQDSPLETATPTVDGAESATEPPPTPPRKPRRIGWIIAVVLLSVALIATGAVLALSLIRLDEARDEIDQQQDLIDKKETFGAAAQELMDTAAQFDGLPYATLVEADSVARHIHAGWTDRWSGAALDRDTDRVEQTTAKLAAILEAARVQASTNDTGTFFESITDQLGTGFVATSLDTADTACAEDVWGCVVDTVPLTIHYDASETNGQPYMSDWLRTGIAYHEYAHILQDTNPAPTRLAAESFGGDWETMADCYALTYLPGWTLDHRIWVGEYEYWDVSVGYGYTCDETQRQVVRDWVDSLGYTHEPIS